MGIVGLIIGSSISLFIQALLMLDFEHFTWTWHFLIPAISSWLLSLCWNPVKRWLCVSGLGAALSLNVLFPFSVMGFTLLFLMASYLTFRGTKSSYSTVLLPPLLGIFLSWYTISYLLKVFAEEWSWPEIFSVTGFLILPVLFFQTVKQKQFLASWIILFLCFLSDGLLVALYEVLEPLVVFFVVILGMGTALVVMKKPEVTTKYARLWAYTHVVLPTIYLVVRVVRP